VEDRNRAAYTDVRTSYMCCEAPMRRDESEKVSGESIQGSGVNLRNLVETWAEYSLYVVTQSRYVRIRDHKQLHSGREFYSPGPLEP
jgi:hypothetical protein